MGEGFMKINANSPGINELKNRTKKQKEETPQMQDSVSLTVPSDRASYIILPKNNYLKSFAGEEGECNELSEKKLEDYNVKIDKKLPVVDGFSATLTSKQKEELEKAGFALYEDKEERWIPEPGIFSRL